MNFRLGWFADGERERREDRERLTMQYDNEDRSSRLRRARLRRALGDDIRGDGGAGSTLTQEDRMEEIVASREKEGWGREKALSYSVYTRAVIQTAEAAALLMAEAEPETGRKETSYKRVRDRGFTGYQNRYNYWLQAFINVQIDGVYYGEMVGSSESRVVKNHPKESILPAMMEEGLVFHVLGKRVPGELDKREKRTVDDRDMLHILRPNTNPFYELQDGGPVFTDVVCPVPTYEVLKDVIRMGLAIDRLERHFWLSDGTLKFGVVMSSDQQVTEDIEILKSIVNANRVGTPFKATGEDFKISTVQAFEDYRDTLHAIKDDLESRIASFFGQNASDLGSDAARTGTSAQDLSENVWRNAVLPLVNSAKYEVEKKMLNNTVLNVPSLRYFLSSDNAAKLAQSLGGLGKRNEIRKNLFDMPPLSDEEGGNELYRGGQESSEMQKPQETNNEEGENM